MIRDSVRSVLEKSGIPVGLISEEAQGVEAFNGNPEYLIALDEQDGYGLSAMRNFPKHIRYGTMAAILEGNNASFKDTIIGGTIEHYPKLKLVYGSKSANKSFIRYSNGRKKLAMASKRKRLDKRAKICTDTWFGAVNVMFDIPFHEFGAIDIADIGGSAIGYVDITTGDMHGLGECTRKDNLELITSYLMIRNAGGQMYAITAPNATDGINFTGFELKDIGDWDYLKSAKVAKKARIPILTVCTSELGHAMVDHINKFYDWKGPLMKEKIKFEGIKKK